MFCYISFQRKHCRDNVSALQTFRSHCAPECQDVLLQNCLKTPVFAAHGFLSLLPKLLFRILEQNFQCQVPMSCCMAPCFCSSKLCFLLPALGFYLLTQWILFDCSLHSPFLSSYLSLWNKRAKASLVERTTWDHLVQHHLWLDRTRILLPEVSKESLYIIK